MRLFPLPVNFAHRLGLSLPFALLLLILPSACQEAGSASAPVDIGPVVSAPSEPEPETQCAAAISHVQEGIASNYGKPHHGRRTANGEIFDMNALTAAHRNLPMGTRIRVTNLANGKTIELRVNDRGPYVKKRVLDVSRYAAQELGFTKKGITRVRIETIPPCNAKPTEKMAGDPSPQPTSEIR